MKALVLCGGLGERLRPLTEDKPKAMLEVRGKPLLEYVIKFLKKNGLEDIVLLCGYKHEEIEKYFGDGKKFSVNLNYSVEEEKLGTAGAVANAIKYIDSDFIVVNGDVITDFPLKDMIKEFEKTGKNLMALVKPNNPFGIAKISEIDGKICRIDSFVEKPKMDEWINAGYLILKKDVFKMFRGRGDAESEVYPLLQKRGELLGFLIDDKYFWKSIDSIKDWKEVNGMQG